jgi:8-oxo-dGTP pyrophosphatase MutT (NUDIX family)
LSAGNRLDGAKVNWVFRPDGHREVIFLWAIHVDIFIASENRHKTNEFVIARPDISTIVLYRRRDPLFDSEIVLVREFRSPVSNKEGFVWEAPGGSTFKAGDVDTKTLAAHECEEEVGITIDPSRIKEHGSRQLMATLSAHRAHVFSAELTEEELKNLRVQKNVAHGVPEDAERTYIEIVTLKEMMERPLVDWSMIGIIFSVLSV